MFCPSPESELPVAEGREKTVVFDRTSSPELDSILTEILHKVILPAHLPSQKQRLISLERNRQRLAVDPVIVEVDGYEHKFEVLDFKHGHVPKTSPLVRKAFRLMKTREDWANLGRLLSGLALAKRRFRRQEFQLLVQEAGRTRNMYAVLDALTRNKYSGLEVTTLNSADNVLHQLAAMAWESGYAYKETKKASSWASRFLEIVATSKHASFSREPQVIGQALHLAASEALFHHGGKDTEERVVDHAKTLIEEWAFKTEKVEKPSDGRPLGLLDLHSSKEEVIESGTARLIAHSKALWYLHLDPSRHITILCYLIKGIEWASQVVPQLAGSLKPIREGCEYELQIHVENRDGTDVDFKGKKLPCKMGWAVYDALMVEGERPVNWGPSKEEVEAEFAEEVKGQHDEKAEAQRKGEEDI